MEFRTKVIRTIRAVFNELTWEKPYPTVMDHIMKKHDRDSMSLLREGNNHEELRKFIRAEWNKYHDRYLKIYVPQEKKEAYERTKAKIKEERRYCT